MLKSSRRKQILVLCTHFHSDRSDKREKIFLQTMAGLHVASMLDCEKYEVKLYHESYHGPYNQTDIDRADIVFLTGLQKDFDRMRQLSYLFQRQGAIVVAGGNICTLFPEFAAEFFNVVCVGGVECAKSVMRDFEAGSLKTIYRSPQTEVSNYAVNYSLLRENGIHCPVHFVEASRGCNFKCDFCVIPAEGANHATYRVETVATSIEKAIESTVWSSVQRLFPCIFFIDNNFSNNLSYMYELCAYLRKARSVKAWGALVTQNILQKRDVIKMMAESKCRALFTGIESFDLKFLETHNKKQNLAGSGNAIDNIRFAHQQGIVIYYPYMFDPRISSVVEMKRELEMLVNLEDLTFPDFFTTVSPLVGTKLFWENVENKELLPNLRLRDLDGQALSYRHTVDSYEAYSEFFSLLYENTLQLVDRKRFFWKIARGMLNFGFRYPLSTFLFYKGSTNHIDGARKHSRTVKRNYIGGQDVLDPQYRQYPANITADDKARYFDPIQITDDRGNISPWLERYKPVAIANR